MDKIETRFGECGLKIPVQIASKNIDDTKIVEDYQTWRSNLPITNTGKAAKSIYLRLCALLKNEVNHNIRLELLNILRPPLQMICHSLEKHFDNLGIQIPENKITVVHLIDTLQNYMSLGYNQIIEDVLKNDPNNKQDLSYAIAFSMKYTSETIKRRFLLYEQPENGIWLELHKLYRIGEESKSLAIEHIISSSQSNCMSIKQIYLNIILLSSSNPYKWRQSDQYPLCKLINIWVQYANISSKKPNSNETKGVFYIDTKQDKGPIPLGLLYSNLGNDGIFLDVNPLINELKNHLKNDNLHDIKISYDKNKKYSKNIPISVLDQLYSIWEKEITRSGERYKISGHVNVAFGISAVHYFLNNRKNFDPQADLKLNSNNLNVEIDEQLDNSVEEILIHGNVNFNDEYEIFNTKIINISPTGICIEISGNYLPTIQPGECVCYLDEFNEENDKWLLGTIRWFRFDTKRRLQIGIEVITNCYKPAAVHILKDEKPIGYLQRSVILSHIYNKNIENVLLTPTIPFAENKRISILIDNNVMVNATLTKLISYTGSYKIFEFTPDETISTPDQEKLIENEEPTESNTLGNIDDSATEFDSIWEDL